VWIATQEGRKIHDFEVPGLVTSVDTSKHRFSMAFLSDEKRLLIVAADGHLYLLDPGAERILAEGRLGDVPQGPLSMPAARDRFAIATEKPGGFEDHVEVWRIDPLERISDWSGKDHNPCLRGRSVSFSADGERMAVAHLHEGVRICTKYSSLVSKRHDLKDAGLAPTQLRFAAHGSRLVVQGLYGETRVYDAESAATLASLRTYGRDVDYALLSPNGNLVVTGLSGAGTRIWDLGRGVDDTATDELRERPKTDARLSQSLSPDGRTLVYASSTREVWRLDAELRPQRIDLARSGVIEENSMPAHVSWDATGVRFVVVPPKGAPALVDAKSWTATELPFVEKPERVATDSAGRFVAYNQLHGGLRVCDTSKLPARANAAPSTATLCKRHINYDHYLYDLALSPDGQLLAALGSASLDETDLLVWDRVSGKVVLKVRGDKSQPRHVVFSALGRHLAATAENDGTLASWEITRSGNAWSFQQRPSIRDAGKTWDIAISADGRLLASWGLEDAVKLWDAETGALIRSIHGGVGHEGAAAFIGDTNQFVRLSGGLHKHACRACRPVAELLKEARRDLLAIPTTGN
jgi:WD40 repeat protein